SCSTFAKSSAAAIAMPYGIVFILILITSLMSSLISLIGGVTGIDTLFLRPIILIWVPFLSPPVWFWWACRRLRLPAIKVHV
ncbi:MAG: hypothetical protein OXI96_07565, partial [Acidimicrobiaceae bacterium]|nr:hypothetical protein [Acidimicrobiaceae bacterium]